MDMGGISAPDQTYWSVEFVEELNTARFGTYGRGIWDFVMDEYYNIIMGDLNSDSVVNVQDIIILVNFILNILDPTELQIYAADLNEDQVIDILDIIILINIVLGS